MQSMIDQADDDLLWHESMKTRVGCTEMPSIQIQSKEMRIRLKTSELQVSAHGYPLSQRGGAWGVMVIYWKFGKKCK